MFSENPAHHVLVNVHAEGQRDLPGNSRTTPGRITSFHFHDGIDQFLGWPLRTRPTTALGRKQHAVLSFGEYVMEMQQRGWLQDNTAAQHTRWVHEKGAETGDHAIGKTQARSSLPTAIEDEQLMPSERRFRDDGTKAARFYKPDDGDNR